MQLSVEIEGYSTYRGMAKDILKASDELRDVGECSIYALIRA